MLQPKNVHQLLRNQNSGVPCETFSSTTTMTTKINSKWGPKSKIFSYSRESDINKQISKSYHIQT